MEVATPATGFSTSSSVRSQLQNSLNPSIPKTPNNKFRIKSAASATSITHYRSQPTSPRSSSSKFQATKKNTPKIIETNSSYKTNENIFHHATPTSQKKPLETAVSLPLVAEDTHINGRKETAKIFTQIIVNEKNEKVSEIKKEHLTYHKHVIIGANDSKKDLDIVFSTSKQRDQYIERNKSGCLYSHELWDRDQLEKVLEYTGLKKIFKSVDAARFKTYEERCKKFNAYFQKKYGKKMDEENQFLQMLNEKGSIPIFSLPGLDVEEERGKFQENFPMKNTSITCRRKSLNPSIIITAPLDEEEIKAKDTHSPKVQANSLANILGSKKRIHDKKIRPNLSVPNVDAPLTGNSHSRTKSDFFAKRGDSSTPLINFQPESFGNQKQRIQSIASIQKLVDECNDYMNTNEVLYK